MNAIFEMKVTNGHWEKIETYKVNYDNDIEQVIKEKTGLMNKYWSVVEGSVKKYSDLEYHVIKNAEWIDEFFNEEDTSVGLYAIGKIDEEVVWDLEDTLEAGTRITNFSEDHMEITINNYYVLVVGLTEYEVGLNEYESKWELVNAYRK